ncbi:MAG: substrate-binding domain-containing protein [Negativicutes bacterium]|nr:substrate-binding domain-containing protein [Negativicutes bacterium]
MKKTLVWLSLLGCLIFLLSGCNFKDNDQFSLTHAITIISREEGSGTRSAFIELFGVEKLNARGVYVDYTTPEAVIADSTAAMLAAVAEDPHTIGYLSIGSLDASVTALSIDSSTASKENILNGSYRMARPFQLVTDRNINGLTQDFTDFILSSEGKPILESAGYLAAEGTESYLGTKQRGKIVIAGSSSISPVMEKLKAAYLERQPAVTVEIRQSDSSAGIAAVAEGSAQLGMSSRALKENELNRGLKATPFALDGIAVIVNKQNPVKNLTTVQIRSIFIGESLRWGDVI